MDELPAPRGQSPDWIAEAIRNARAELILFVRTALGFTAHPGRFSSAWIDGQQRALNPFAFLATSAAVLGVMRALLSPLFPKNAPDAGILGQILDALGPYAHYALLGVLAHGVFRLTGSKAQVRDSLAVALFAGGGPASIAQLVLTIVAALMFAIRGVESGKPTGGAWLVTILITATASFTVFSFAFATGMAAIHRVGTRFTRTLRLVAAIAVAYVASGLAFGIFDPPGQYGLHFELKPAVRTDAAGKKHFDFNFGLKG